MLYMPSEAELLKARKLLAKPVPSKFTKALAAKYSRARAVVSTYAYEPLAWLHLQTWAREAGHSPVVTGAAFEAYTASVRAEWMTFIAAEAA